MALRIPMYFPSSKSLVYTAHLALLIPIHITLVSTLLSLTVLTLLPFHLGVGVLVGKVYRQGPLTVGQSQRTQLHRDFVLAHAVCCVG